MNKNNTNEWSYDHGNNCQPSIPLDKDFEQDLPSHEKQLKDLQEKEYQQSVGKFFLDRNAEYPDPEYLIEIGGVPTLPKGNLAAVSAKWKSGKTFFCDILSAVFLGSDHFAGCHGLQQTGKVLFFDTEQAVSDTARIHKIIDAMTPEQRHNDLGVACLREAPIDTNVDSSPEVSRYDAIVCAIEHEHPDLVIIDGIADLIYNYNDVIESMDMVNKLAAVASRHNCCIVVVMHQNKGAKDKNMKGHIGTMLYQKGSDVFNVEKHGTLFEVTHSFSRHRLSEGLCFKLDAKAVPMDAIADRQLQIELERQHKQSQMREEMAQLLDEVEMPAERGDIAKALMEAKGVKRAQSYNIVKKAIEIGLLVTDNNKDYYIKREI